MITTRSAPPDLRDVFNPDEVIAKVPEQYRAAVAGLIRAARQPTSLVAELHATKDGMHGPGYSWDVIGRAVQEMAAGGMSFSARLLRACCRKIVEGELGPKPSTDDLVKHRAATSAATVAADKAAADQGDATIVEEQYTADQFRAEHPEEAEEVIRAIDRRFQGKSRGAMHETSRILAINAALARAARALPVKVSA